MSIKLTRYLLILISFSTLINAEASNTTLRFEIPKPDLDPNKTYSQEDLYTTPYFERTNTKGGTIKKFNLTPLSKYSEKIFEAGSPINKYFVNEFVAAQLRAEDELKNIISQEPLVQDVSNVKIEQKPLSVILGVRNNKIIFEMKGLKFSTRARLRLSGLEEVICGTHPTATLQANIEAYGEYDLNSGSVYINNINLNQSADIDCTGFLGSVLQFAVDYIVDNKAEEYATDFINPILMSSIYVGALDNLFSQEAREASSKLGIDIIQEGWTALSRYTDGLTLEFNIGVDYYAQASHLIEFKFYQEPVNFNISSSYRGSRGAASKLNTANFTCPSWAKNLNVYEAIYIPTDYQRKSREFRNPIYSERKYKKLDIHGLSFSGYLSCSGGIHCDTKDLAEKNYIASCEGHNGLSSYQSSAAPF